MTTTVLAVTFEQQHIFTNRFFSVLKYTCFPAFLAYLMSFVSSLTYTFWVPDLSVFQYLEGHISKTVGQIFIFFADSESSLKALKLILEQYNKIHRASFLFYIKN